MLLLDKVAQLPLRVVVVESDLLNLAGQIRLLCSTLLQLTGHTTDLILKNTRKIEFWKIINRQWYS